MSSVNTNDLVQQILEGASPRDVIGSAVAESTEPAATQEGVTPTDEVATVTKKVVRNGKIVKKKFKKYKKRRILSAAQKRALKKAQQASKKSTAKIKRVKSLRKAATFEGAEDEENLTVDIICPECGTHGMEVLDCDDCEATIFVCPDCGKEFALVDAEALKDLIPDDEDDDSDVDIDIADDDEVVDAEEDGDAEPADESVETCPVCGKPKTDCVCGDPTPEDDEDKDGEEPLYFEPEN